MSGIDRRAVLTLAGAGVAFAASAHATTIAADAPGLDGAWEGTLTPATGPGIAVPPDHGYPPIRIEIDQRNVRVYLSGTQAMPGLFTIERQTTNAVISATQADPGAPVGQSWVETWTFVVTMADPNTLALTFVRVVNNNQLAPTADGAHFTQVHTGQFHRVPDVR